MVGVNGGAGVAGGLYADSTNGRSSLWTIGPGVVGIRVGLGVFVGVALGVGVPVVVGLGVAVTTITTVWDVAVGWGSCGWGYAAGVGVFSVDAVTGDLTASWMDGVGV